MPRFSVIVPVYDVEPYLDHCVESVVKQTYGDFELILVDDGSPDNSGAMCDRWAEKDPRITVLHKENGGLSSARNYGLDRARGDYVVFLDSDDYWLTPQVLEALALRLDRTGADVLIFNILKEFNGVLEAPYFPADLIMPEELREDDAARFVKEHDLWTACAWNKAIHRKLFAEGQLRFREGITSEDIDWCLRLALDARRFDFLGLGVVGYRQRVGSITGSVTPQKVRCLCGNVRECLGLLEERKPGDPALLQAYIAYQYGTLVYNIAGLPASPEKKRLVSGAKELAYVLEWSDNGKVSLIRKAKKLLGFPVTLWLLGLKGRHDSKKRSD